MVNVIKAFALGVVVAVSGMSGSATTYDPSLSANPLTLQAGGACEVGSIQGATACNGVFSGNDSNSNLDGIFGMTGWNELFKLNGGSGTAGADGIELTVSDNNDGKSWRINSYGGFDSVMFVMKGGPSFSAFLMNTSILSGSWDNLSMFTGGNNAKPGAGLSHWTVYANSNPAPIPLPAAGLLLITALGGLAAMRRRRNPTT